jgi:peptidase E
MRLVLASQGFLPNEIAEAAAKLVGKPMGEISVAIINESYVAIDPGHDMRWLLDELNHIPEHFGGAVSFVNIRAYDMGEARKRLEPADIIYIVGGKQKILPELFAATGFDKLLRELAETKVVFGTSAGAIYLGQMIEEPTYREKFYDLSFMKAKTMGLADFQILPHWGRADHAERTPELMAELLRKCTFPIYAIHDGQAVIYNDGKTEFVGGKPVKFGAQVER